MVLKSPKHWEKSKKWLCYKPEKFTRRYWTPGRVVIWNGEWKYVSIGRNILFYLIIIFNFQKLRTSFDSYELLNFQVMKGRQRIDNFAKQKKKKEKKTLNLNIFSPLQIPQHLQHWQPGLTLNQW